MIPETNKIYVGDCLDVMRSWPDNFIDTIITDGPYGLSFMGRDWDHGVPGIPFWAEMLRICKPGAMLLSFGGTRTFHRMTVAIEDAGWQIRDCMTWLYGSGFPKSLDISKAIDKAKGAKRKVIGEYKYPDGSGKRKVIDSSKSAAQFGSNRPGGSSPVTSPTTNGAKQWNGYGTALKPAWEPIIVAMKPLDGTFAQNAEKWGVAGLNVDGGRIRVNDEEPNKRRATGQNGGSGSMFGVGNSSRPETLSQGRWPANLILDEEAAAMLDWQSGNSKSGGTGGGGKTFHGQDYIQPEISVFPNSGGASRFFYVAKADRAERNEGCEGMPEKEAQAYGSIRSKRGNGYEEATQIKNNHPTVKPLSLMKYLCNLTKTPTGGIVLDPFAGSGTTLWAAECHNRPWIGIEKDVSYVEIAKARLVRERSQIKLAL